MAADLTAQVGDDPVAQGGGPAVEIALVQDVEGGQGGGARHRIAAEGGAVGAGGPALHEGAGRDDAAQRQARGDALGEQQHVRADAVGLGRERAPGAADPALHLVEHQEDAVRIAALAQAGQPGPRRGHVAALAQHRLHHHGAHVGRRRLQGQDQVELGQGGLHRGVGAGVLVGHAVGGVVDARQQRLVALAVAALGRGQRGGGQGAAVERPAEGDDPRPAGELAGQLEGAVHRLGARVAEEDLRLVEERAQGADPLGQLDVAGVVHHHRRVDQRGGLLRDGRHHPRVRVPGRVHRDARTQVEVAPPLDVDQPRALAPGRHHVVVAGQHPGERVVVAGQPPRRRLAQRGGHRGHDSSRGCVSIWAFWRRPE
jgi:hypothetical protein